MINKQNTTLKKRWVADVQFKFYTYGSTKPNGWTILTAALPDE